MSVITWEAVLGISAHGVCRGGWNICYVSMPCWVAVDWGGIASFIVLVTMLGYFSLPCRLLLFLPVVSSVELI